MTKHTLVLLLALTATAGAFAQNNSAAVTSSTDPAKIAAIEKHAQELKMRPTQEVAAAPAAKQASTHKAKTGASSGHGSKSSTAKSAPKTTTKSTTKPAAKPKA